MISTVKQEGSMLRIYDENGQCKTTISAQDGLVGYTSSTVSVKQGSCTQFMMKTGTFRQPFNFLKFSMQEPALHGL